MSLSIFKSEKKTIKYITEKEYRKPIDEYLEELEKRIVIKIAKNQINN